MQTLAIQLDQKQCRLVLVESSGKGSARIVSIATAPREEQSASQAESIRGALPSLKRGARLTVALPGDEVRSRRLRAPAASEDELLQILTLQVEREALRDALAVDFVTLPSEGDEGVEALTAWCDEKHISHWREVAETLGCKLQHVAPRGLCSAAMFPESAQLNLIATSHDREIDFLLLSKGLPLFLRSTRLSEETPDAAERELKRTLLSASQEVLAETSQPGVIEVMHAGALRDVQDHDQVRLVSHDPKELVSTAFRGSIDAEAAAECLPALGAAKLVVDSVAPAIDLANPRGADKGDRQKAPNLTLVAATVVVLLAGAWMAYAYQASLKNKIATQQEALAAAEQGAERFAPYRQRSEAIDEWLASDVTWLDELDRLSRSIRPVELSEKDFPTADDMRVSQILATAAVGSGELGGVMVLQARAKSASTQGVESRLRDAIHSIEPNSMAEVEATDGYRYRYTARLGVPAARDVSYEEAPE